MQTPKVVRKHLVVMFSVDSFLGNTALGKLGMVAFSQSQIVAVASQKVKLHWLSQDHL